MKKKVLLTLAEDCEKSTANHFAVIYKVDQEDFLHFADSLIDKGYEVYFANWTNYDNGEFSRVFNYGSKVFVEEKIDDMNLIFVYKQEGFLNNLPCFFEMLERFEESGAIVVNHPNTIRKNISKDYLFELQRDGFNIIPTYELTDEVIERIKGGEKFVVKPKVAERGMGQGLVNDFDGVKSFLDNRDKFIAQEYCPSIRNGEISLVFVGKEYSHSLIKWPNKEDPNEYRCNESVGGSWAKYEPTDKEMAYSKRMLDYWENNGFPVCFTRIDIVNVDGEPTLVEIELVNPSVSANYLKIGKEFGEMIATHFDNLIEKNKCEKDIE